jgi:hypothetical protein
MRGPFPPSRFKSEFRPTRDQIHKKRNTLTVVEAAAVWFSPTVIRLTDKQSERNRLCAESGREGCAGRVTDSCLNRDKPETKQDARDFFAVESPSAGKEITSK